MSKNTQPVFIDELDVSKLIFTEPKFSSIPNSTPKIEFCKIGVMYQNPDGTKGDLVITTKSPMFSYGLSQYKDPISQEVISHSMTFVLCNDMNKQTNEEQERKDKLNALYDKLKEHIYKVRKDIKRGSLKEHELLTLLPYSERKNKETGEIDESKSPLWNVKLKEFKKRIHEGKEIEGKIGCNFYNIEEADEDGYSKLIETPMDLIGKKMDTTPMVKLDSIFIGSKIISIQMRLIECEIKLHPTGPKRYLKTRVKDHKEDNKDENIF